jgi:predicted unusual protein kinase regulating ubiquinone biosynthesis (AarF/ABC1/UbiB family)
MRRDPERFEHHLAGFVERLRAGPADSRAQSRLGRFLRTAAGAAELASRIWRARGKEGLEALDEAALEALVRQLGRLKGIPMKVGQLVGFLELDLPEDMRQLFAVLQTQSQPTSFEEITAFVKEDLGGSADALLATMDRHPVSVASIGQVHRAAPGGRAAAVKVRHPHVEESIRSDLSGAIVATAIAGRLLPGIGASAREFVNEAKARFLEECDYQLEAERQRLFHGAFTGHPDIVVPEVLDPWCGPRVLTSSWEEGLDLESFVASATQAERDRAGRALFEAYVGTLYRRGLLHADPHPGNYRFRPGGAVVLFDYGCVRVFEPEVVAALVALADGARRRDEDRVRSALRGLGAEPSADPGAFSGIQALLEGFFAPLLTAGPHAVDSSVALDLRRLTSDKLAIARMRLPGKLLFLMRLRFGLYSVLARLGAVCDWGELEASWAQRGLSRPSP